MFHSYFQQKWGGLKFPSPSIAPWMVIWYCQCVRLVYSLKPHSLPMACVTKLSLGFLQKVKLVSWVKISSNLLCSQITWGKEFISSCLHLRSRAGLGGINSRRKILQSIQKLWQNHSIKMLWQWACL